MFRCFRCCGLNNYDDEFKKSTHKLAAELDITRILNSLRFMRNAVRYLTTRRERMLLRMQADKIMIVVKEEEKAQLKQDVSKKSLPEILKSVEESSMYETDDQIAFLENLQAQKEQTSDLELELIAGLFTNKDAIEKTMLEKPKKKKRIKAPQQHQKNDSHLYIGDVSFAFAEKTRPAEAEIRIQTLQSETVFVK